MKKVILFGVVMIFALNSACVIYNAENDFRVEVVDGGKGVYITGYKGSNFVIRIPPKIKNLPVTGIDYEAFKDHTNLTSISLPNSIKCIRYEAFKGCSNLTSIIIPANVSEIGSGAFSYCNSLTNVTFKGRITADNISSGGRGYVGQPPFGYSTFWEPSFDGDLKEKYLTGGIGTYKKASDGKWIKQ